MTTRPMTAEELFYEIVERAPFPDPLDGATLDERNLWVEACMGWSQRNLPALYDRFVRSQTEVDILEGLIERPRCRHCGKGLFFDGEA